MSDYQGTQLQIVDYRWGGFCRSLIRSKVGVVLHYGVDNRAGQGCGKFVVYNIRSVGLGSFPEITSGQWIRDSTRTHVRPSGRRTDTKSNDLELWRTRGHFWGLNHFGITRSAAILWCLWSSSCFLWPELLVLLVKGRVNFRKHSKLEISVEKHNITGDAK
jgi:hypothetical protein